MQYTEEQLDRRTGALVEVSLGNYITVTELGERYGKGPRQVRAILHHIGVLGCEQPHGRYRLPRYAVKAGLGVRHDKPKSGFPFDVLSPKAQELIAEVWGDAVAELEAEQAANPAVSEAKAALEEFCSARKRKLETKEEVSWLQHHFPKLMNREIASILQTSEQLVGRYAKQAAERRAYLKRQVEAELPERYSQQERIARITEHPERYRDEIVPIAEY